VPGTGEITWFPLWVVKVNLCCQPVCVVLDSQTLLKGCGQDKDPHAQKQRRRTPGAAKQLSSTRKIFVFNKARAELRVGGPDFAYNLRNLM